MYITKRDGKQAIFNKEKIIIAITKANNEVSKEAQISEHIILAIADEIEKEVSLENREVAIEEIQDMVENYLIKYGAAVVAKQYIKYRYARMLARKANTTDNAILSLIDLQNEEALTENANKNPIINSTQRDYMAGEVSKDLTKRVLLPEDIVKAHESGIIHFHDSDYFAQKMYNCSLINLEDMLQYGSVISGKMIEKPKSFHTACNITTQIVAQVASNQYGGQTFNLAHLIPFVQVSREKLRRKVREELKEINPSNELINKVAEARVKDEIKSGVQLIQYQLITLMTTNGQAPFVSMFMHLEDVPPSMMDDYALVIEEVLKQRYIGVKNEKGAWITPEFPKLLYVTDESNIHEDSKYFYLTQLAAKCTAKRLVPDYISAKKMREYKEGDVFGCMGCRSFLSVDRFHKNISKALNYKEGEHKYWGRFNQGVVTINLPDVACASYGNQENFWEILEERLELCHRALRYRHERLLGTISDVAPILWQYGALARLEKGEVIDPLLFNGYSTISLGYTGLYECCVRMMGESHTSMKGQEFAKEVMRKLNEKCEEWKKKENIDYSVYGTPMESTTYKFAKATRERYGVIKDVTDHNYQTNSYHVVVREHINAFDKLKFESQFQPLSPGGAISYVEVPNLQNNIPAVISIIQYMYDTIMYAEINTKSDYCQECGYDGEIMIVEDEDKKLVWECPNCKNRNHDKMNVARRVCGYIGANEMNQGRMGDIKDRVLHTS